MIVKLLTEHHWEFLSLTGGCRGSSESTLVKMSNCWKSHATANVNFQSAGGTGFVAHLPKKLKTSGIEYLHTISF